MVRMTVDPFRTIALPVGVWLITYIGNDGSVPSTGERTGLKPKVANKSLAAEPKTGPVDEVVTSGK